MILSEMSIIELKALAYDKIAMGEQIQKDLAMINQTILAKLREAQDETTDKQTTPKPAGDKRIPEGKTKAGKN